MKRLIFAAAAATALMSMPAHAQSGKTGGQASIKDFFGEYVGKAISRKPAGGDGRGKKDREANVVIKAAGQGGFSITWVTIRRVSVFASKRETRFTEMTFAPAGKANRWRWTKNKPLADGGPMAFAALSGRTLTIHVLALDGRGRLHAATYLRTLSRTGLHLVFRRGLNSLQVRRVAATLKRRK